MILIDNVRSSAGILGNNISVSAYDDNRCWVIDHTCANELFSHSL